MKFFNFSLLICTVLVVTATSAEESCYGSDDCKEEVHNVWVEDEYAEEIEVEDEERESSKSPVKADHDILQLFQENGVTLTKLEVELLLNHLDKGDDGRVDMKDLESIKTHAGDPMYIVQSVIESFNRLDKDNDGKLSKSELPSERGEEDAEEITIVHYLEIVSHLDKSVFNALQAFVALSFLTPPEIKNIMTSSLKAFKENDEDASGGLNMEEFLKQVDKKNIKSEEISQEKKEAVFAIIDKDSDGEISYSEFQATMPKGPPNPGKNLAEIFDKADQDSDGFWSMEEFTEHMKEMIKHTKATEPPESDVFNAFNHLDKDKDGRVSKEEMQGIHKEIENIQEQKAVQGFAEMDQDGNGHLTRDEMKLMAEAMEQKAGQQSVDVDLLIQMLDTNENGVVELEEVKAMVQKMMPHVKQPI